MKKRSTSEQIIGFLQEAEGSGPLKELCRRRGFSEGSFFVWRNKFGGMNVSDAKRLMELETGNARFKKRFAESLSGNEVSREVIRKSGDRIRSPGRGAVHEKSWLE